MSILKTLTSLIPGVKRESDIRPPVKKFEREKIKFRGDERLPFTLKDVKAAIPAECFEPSALRSLSYFFLDISIIAGLYALAFYINSWFFWPVFWFLQGTMFWALFVVGHDCGHGSFSKSKSLNNIIGHLSHSPILVPFNGWRISHRIHHQNTGHIENEETWYPHTKSEYDNLKWSVKVLRFNPVFFLFLFPFYMVRRSTRQDGSHFMPGSDLFTPSEGGGVILSTFCYGLMLGLLGFLTYQFGFLFLLKYYLGPWLVFLAWLDLVTYLHHTHAEIPWYRGEEWSFLRGALSTMDRTYGIFEPIHHNIGTHVAHHIFISIPHYHLRKATAAIVPLLGEYYHKSDKSVLRAVSDSLKACKHVPDAGGMVYYSPDDG